MPIEIERKFLVKGDFTPYIERTERIIQAYLCATEDTTVRIRMKGDKAFLTIKGPSDQKGFSRYEFEYEIPFDDAKDLLNICLPGIIEKDRHYIKAGKHTFEIDVFHGNNEGLVIAELELESIQEIFEKPDWLGDEVTGNKNYYNAYLIKYPYNFER